MKVAIIPARGGSKRIPGKNLRLFKGKPIIQYSIEAALSAGLFDKVLISTDDPEIMRVGEAGGAEILFDRPEHLADDHATLLDVMGHAIGWMKSMGWRLDVVAMVYATAPMIEPKLLAESVSRVASGQVSKCISVAPMPFPAQRAFVSNDNGELQYMMEEHRYTRSQDLPLTYHDAAQFVVSSPDCFTDRTVPYYAVIVPQMAVQDIDNEEDWELAEIKYDLLSRMQRERQS